MIERTTIEIVDWYNEGNTILKFDKVWVSKEDLIKEINGIHERYIMKIENDESAEPVKTTLGLFVASVNHPISAMKAELLELLK